METSPSRVLKEAVLLLSYHGLHGRREAAPKENQAGCEVCKWVPSALRVEPTPPPRLNVPDYVKRSSLVR